MNRALPLSLKVIWMLFYYLILAARCLNIYIHAIANIYGIGLAIIPLILDVTVEIQAIYRKHGVLHMRNAMMQTT